MISEARARPAPRPLATTTTNLPSPITMMPDMPSNLIEKAAWLPPTAVRIPSRAGAVVARLVSMMIDDLNARATCNLSTSSSPARAALRYVLASHAKLSSNIIRDRAKLAIEGKWAELAASIPPPSDHRTRSNGPNPSKAKHLIECGNLTRAIAALSARPAPRPFTRGDVELLFPSATTRALPTPPRPAAGPSYLRRAATEVDPWVDQVWRGVKRLKPESQPGPSGLRGEHLHLTAKRHPAFRQAFADTVDHLVAGRLHGESVADSTLGMIPKDETFRPVGVGEVLRRVAARLVARELGERVRPTLEQNQQFVLTRNGTALAHLSVRDDVAAGLHVLQLDVRNAYNTVCRKAMWDAIGRSDPALPIIYSLYGESNNLRVPALGHCVVQDRGVVQGCPLSSHLFAITLNEATAGVATRHPDVKGTWFADDVHVTSRSLVALDLYLNDLVIVLSDIGLELSATKCRRMSPPAAEPHAVPRALGLSSTPADILKVLGAPLIHPNHPRRDELRAAEWSAFATKLTKAVDRLALLTEPQHLAYAIAQAGSWPRLELRATLTALDGCSIPQLVLAAADAADRRALASALGEADLDDEAWQRAHIPTRAGGIGIRDPHVEVTMAPLLAATIRPDPAARPLDLKAARVAAYDKSLLKLLDCNPQGTHRGEVLRDIVVAAPHYWLCLPASTSTGTLMAPEVARAAIGVFLGARVLPPHTTCRCHGRDTQVDVYADHVGGCYNYLSARHNSVRDVLAAAARTAFGSANVRTEMNADELGRPISAEGRRPGDMVYRLDNTQPWTYTDVTVQSAIPSFLSARISGQVDRPASLAEFGVEQKKERNKLDAARFGKSLVFCGVGAYGSLSRNTNRVIDDVAWALTSKALQPYRTAPHLYIRWRIQAALWSKLGSNVYDLRRRTTADILQGRRIPYNPPPQPALPQPRYDGFAPMIRVQSSNHQVMTARVSGATPVQRLVVAKRRRSTPQQSAAEARKRIATGVAVAAAAAGDRHADTPDLRALFRQAQADVDRSVRELQERLLVPRRVTLHNRTTADRSVPRISTPPDLHIDPTPVAPVVQNGIIRPSNGLMDGDIYDHDRLQDIDPQRSTLACLPHPKANNLLLDDLEGGEFGNIVPVDCDS